MRVPIRVLLSLLVLSWAAFPVALYAQPADLALTIEKLADPTQRDAAAKELLELGEAALTPLQEALTSKRANDFVRREVLRLLPQFGKAGVGVLKNALADPGLELEAVRQLAQVEDRADLEGVMTVRMEQSLNPRVRLAALEWLDQYGTAQKVTAKLFGLLGDPSEAVRKRAASLIADRQGVQAVPQLMEMLRKAEFDRSPANRGLRSALVETMGKIGQKSPADAARVVPTILRSLGEEDEKSVAVAALIAIGAPSVSSLLMILKAGDTRRAAAAMDALLAIGQKAAPEVVSLLQARHPKMKRMARQFLGFYQDPAVFPLLRQLYPRVSAEDKVAILRIASLYRTQEPYDFIVQATADEDGAVRSEAVRILASTGEKGAIPVVLTRAEEDSDQDIRIAAINGLFSMGATSAVNNLGRMLEYEKWPVRYELLQALAFMATPATVKSIAEQLRHRRSEVANAASRALANITYLGGERTPDEWVRDVEQALGSDEDLKIDTTLKTVVFGDESLEVLLLGDAKQAIIYLVPSAIPQARYVKRYLSTLAENYTVAVLPFDGCGSKGGDQLTATQCFSRQAERIELVRQELIGRPVVVLAQGITGFSGLTYASTYPEGLSALVIADPIFPRRAQVEKTLDETMARLPARWKKELEYLNRVSGRLLPAARNAYLSRIELASQLRAEGKAMLVATGYYGLTWFLSQTFFPFEDTSIETALANVRVPILLVFGADDFALKTNLEPFKRIGKIRKNLVATRLNGAIRWCMVEQSETFQKAVLYFLSSYRVGGFQPAGVGGKWPSGQIVYGETGQFDEARSVTVLPDDFSSRRGDLVESSRLTQFLAANSPGKTSKGTEVAELARQQEQERLAAARQEAEAQREAEAAQKAAAAALAAEQEASVAAAQEAARKAEMERLLAEKAALEAEKARLAAAEAEATSTPPVPVVAPPVPRVDGEAEAAHERSAQGEAEGPGGLAEKAEELGRAIAEAEALQAEKAAALEAEKAAALEAEKAAALEAEKAAALEAEAARREAEARRQAAEAKQEAAVTPPAGAGDFGPGSTAAVSSGRQADSLTYVGWGMVGGGLLLVGGGGFSSYLAGDHASKANSLDPNLPDYDQQFDVHLKGAQTWQSLSLVGYGVGAVSLLIGLDLLLDWPISFRKKAPATAWSVQPMAVPGGGLILFNWDIW